MINKYLNENTMSICGDSFLVTIMYYDDHDDDDYDGDDDDDGV